MATTPVYGLRYQGSTDAPHGPNLGQHLAEDVEDELVRIDAAVAASRCVKRGERSTDFSPVDGTEAGIFRLDSIPIVSGRRYAIACTPTRLNSVDTTYVGTHRLRINQTGTATTASTMLVNADAANGKSVTLYAEFTASTTGSSCSVLVSGQRTSGGGSATWHLDSRTFTLSIVDLGIAPANSGVVL